MQVSTQNTGKEGTLAGLTICAMIVLAVIALYFFETPQPTGDAKYFSETTKMSVSVEELSVLINAPKEGVRIKAASALGNFPGNKVAKILLTGLRSRENSQKVKEECERSLKILEAKENQPSPAL